MRICVHLSRDSCSDRVVGGHARKTQRWLLTTNAAATCRISIGMVVLRDHLDLLVEDFPQLDGFIYRVSGDTSLCIYRWCSAESAPRSVACTIESD